MDYLQLQWPLALAKDYASILRIEQSIGASINITKFLMRTLRRKWFGRLEEIRFIQALCGCEYARAMMKSR